MTSRMLVYCAICRKEMDGMKAYGRVPCCCGKVCWNEWEWRRALAILGKEYYHNPVAILQETCDAT